MRHCLILFVLTVLPLLSGRLALAQQSFSQAVGAVPIKAVANQSPLQVPYITWGGDVATFRANGGLATGTNSHFQKLGLNVQLSAGDDFVQQVRNYMGGKTPFLRGTMRMLGQASEVIAKDTRTKPVVIMQLSWSAGDHIVSRAKLKTLNDLKQSGKKVKIACQQGGPHVGLLYDALTAAQLKRDDIDVVFVNDLTGPNGPAEKFRTDSSIDACCVITPDMIGLTGGLESVGTGAEGSVEGAHVLVSTQNMSRSIADVYAVRSDWFKDHQTECQKFVAGYLAATSEVMQMRDEFESSQKMTPSYRSLLAQSQAIFGEDVLPTLEVDAHGLLLDCRFVGLPGQIAFFQQAGNLSGFQHKMSAALDMATQWGYAKSRNGFTDSRFDYKQIASLGGIKYEEPKQRTAAESTDQFMDDDLDSGTIVSFTIHFQPNQTEFSADQYGAEFNRALQSASTFGGAAIVIRGHSDPTKTLINFVKAGMSKGLIRRNGSRGNYQYYLKTNNGSEPLDFNQIKRLSEMIQQGAFEGAGESPLQTMQAAMNLSLSRAASVKDAIMSYAKSNNITVNEAQFAPTGAGISDPVISKPTNLKEAMQNMRVEFRIVKVAPETVKSSDFDF